MIIKDFKESILLFNEYQRMDWKILISLCEICIYFNETKYVLL